MFRRGLLKALGIQSTRACSTPSVASADAPLSSFGGFRFELTDEQKELRQTVRKFSREKIIPNAAHYDETGEFPWSIIEEAHVNGLMNGIIPAKYGGLELDPITSTILYENLSYGCSGITLPIAINEVALQPLLIAGSEELKKKYFGMLLKRPCVASFAATEPGCGSDVSGVKTTSIKDGNEYVINGSKMWITNAGVAEWFYVLTRSDPDLKTPASKAFTGFIVDAEMRGVIKGKKENMMGQRASVTCGITFDSVRVPASQMVGRLGDGFIVTMKAFDQTRPAVAALANGIAARCLDEASNYALERKAFGKPIAENQAVSFMLADMAINLELSRLITFKCAYEIMMGRPGSYFSSIAKCFAADTANIAAANAVQIFGGNGYCKDYPVEKLMRDAKILQIYEGTSQIQRLIISRCLLKCLQQTGSASSTL